MIVYRGLVTLHTPKHTRSAFRRFLANADASPACRVVNQKGLGETHFAVVGIIGRAKKRTRGRGNGQLAKGAPGVHLTCLDWWGGHNVPKVAPIPCAVLTSG